MSGYRDPPSIERLECPVCATPLVELSVGDGGGGGCRSCAGVWVDEAGLVAVRERVFADILARAAPRTAAPRPAVDLPCPTCQEPMRRTKLASATVDFCPGHGTWFDAGELEQLAHTIAVTRNRRTMGTPDTRPPPTAIAGRTREETRRIVDGLSAELSRSIDRIDMLVQAERAARDARYRTW